MMLAAAKGCSIEIRASGPEGERALEALCTLVANKFDEE
jgi:phosphocarrier protein